MKRFFCTICGRVKRVRKYPSDVVSVNSDNVSMREGTCARHSIPVSSFEQMVERKRELFNASILRTPAKSKRRA